MFGLKEIIKAARAAGKTPMSTQDMALMVSDSDWYGGGYLYSGDNWSDARLQHRQSRVRDCDRREAGEFYWPNWYVLNNYEEGDTLLLDTYLTSGDRCEEWTLYEGQWWPTYNMVRDGLDDEVEAWSAIVDAEDARKAKARARRESEEKSKWTLGAVARFVG